MYYNHGNVHWAQGPRSANILLKNIALNGRTEFYFSKYNGLICFSLIINEKSEKKKKKFVLKLGSSRVRFLSCQGHNHGCYANI